MNILVVEDEPRLAKAIVQILHNAGYNAESVSDGTSGYQYASSGLYELVILDIMLPGIDGFEVSRKLRHDKVEVPILMLTARTNVTDKIEGLDHGADDYMTKPFDPEELLARVRALTRRKGEVILDELTFGDLTLELGNSQLVCGNNKVQLSRKELEVLQLFMINNTRTFPKDELLTRIWGADGEANENSVEAYVSFLRKKIKHLKSDVTIKTIRKIGYKLESQ